MPRTIFLREPALVLAFVSAALALFSATVLPVSTEQQGAIVAVVTALIGIAGAFLVAHEKAVPLLAGLAQSVIALAVAFGMHLNVGVQGSIMSFVAAGIALWVRTQVVAKVGSSASPGMVINQVPASSWERADDHAAAREQFRANRSQGFA